MKTRTRWIRSRRRRRRLADARVIVSSSSSYSFAFHTTHVHGLFDQYIYVTLLAYSGELVRELLRQEEQRQEAVDSVRREQPQSAVQTYTQHAQEEPRFRQDRRVRAQW